ncbi:MAG: Nramp family divalent metal transporter [Planctomycetales bacterium]
MSQPGSRVMPPWNRGELIDAPRFTWKNWFALLGPGLLMGGAAIGGGEWLLGPVVTARYGGALMWIATLSILGQVVYNVEISRYALYTGEPIFTGKFRTLPGPMFWVFMYLLLDFGAIFPYLAAHAATPIAALWLGRIPDASNPEHQALLKGIAYGVFLLCFAPMLFGGKIYRSLKALMTFKIFVVLGFLLVLGLCYTSAASWKEVWGGFVRFGTVPVERGEDRNGNGLLDPGEDWDGDGRLDVVEPKFLPAIDTTGDGRPDSFDLNGDGEPDRFVEIGRTPLGAPWLRPAPLESRLQPEGRTPAAGLVPVNQSGRPGFDFLFLDRDGDGTRDGDSVENVFVSLWRGDGWPPIDFSMIAYLAAFAAIAGSGGLTNVPISNYTRDQGWGMGHHVGAIPTLIGGRDIELSHVGTVFEPTPESLPRWKRWYRHVLRDQVVVWMPACFLGVALPSLLSIEFLKRGTLADQWTASGMTAGGVYERVSEVSGSGLGGLFWFMTLFCGALVLAPSMATTIDGFVRRWVDVFWTASPMLRRWDPKHIRPLYFFVLAGYCCLGLSMLYLGKPDDLVLIATNIMNFALGFSCWHTLAVNRILLPRTLRPGWFTTLGLFLAGLFFLALATVSAVWTFGWGSR